MPGPISSQGSANVVVQTWDGAANVTVASTTDILLLTTAPGAARTVTLPAASAKAVGTTITLELGQNGASGNGSTITLSRAGSDTINTFVTSYTPSNAGAYRYILTRASATNFTFSPTLAPDIFGGVLASQYRSGNSLVDGGTGLLLAGPNQGIFVAPLSGTFFYSQSTDLALRRASAGLWEVNSGTMGVYRDLKLRTLIADQTVRLKGYTVSTLPAGTQGDAAFVTDATTPSIGATLVGGGSVVAKAFYNGTNWINA